MLIRYLEEHKVHKILEQLEYIHNNPVKRGYVDDPVHWWYSNVRNYDGKEGLLPVCMNW